MRKLCSRTHSGWPVQLQALDPTRKTGKPGRASAAQGMRTAALLGEDLVSRRLPVVFAGSLAKPAP